MISRRSLLAAPAVLAGAAAISRAPAHARALMVGASTSLVYRFKVGTFEVTAIGDGTLSLATELFPGVQKDPEAAARLLQQSGLRPGPIRTFVNAYLVNTGDQLILIDTGVGRIPSFGSELGKLAPNIGAAGVDPGAVDAVVLTHMHPDHVGGLSLDAKAAFPSAEIVVPEAEYAFWTDPAMEAQAPTDFKPFFEVAKAALQPYAVRTRRVKEGSVLPGLALVAAPGHTPGHSAVRVASGDQQLLVWGDVVHVAALQFERPDWSLVFDSDQGQAAQTRRRMFDMVAQDRLLVAGMHLPFPGLGYVVRRGDAYGYVPEQWHG